MTMTPSAPAKEIEESVLRGMKKAGWSDRELEVVRLWWEYEALPPKQRPRQRLRYGFLMLQANNYSFILSGNRPTPEPLEQLLLAMAEHVAGKPHLFFLKSRGSPPSAGRAYSQDIRDRILGLACAAITRMHHALGMSKAQAIRDVATHLRRQGYVPASGKANGLGASLKKHCMAASNGKARFQDYYDRAMKLRPPDGMEGYSRVHQLLVVMDLLCREWRLLPNGDR